MSPINITLIVLIGLGVLSCIMALIWTKLIRPNSFGYSNKNIVTKRNYQNLIRTLSSKSKIYSYEDIYLKFSEDKNPLIIERMLITTQNVFIITNPIEKKVIDINLDKTNSIKLKYLKKTLDLPLDINIAIANTKLLQSQTKCSNIKIIIPYSNPDIIHFSKDNIYFEHYEKIIDLINKIDNEPSTFDATEFNQLLISKITKKKSKRTFMNLKISKKEY